MATKPITEGTGKRMAVAMEGIAGIDMMVVRGNGSFLLHPCVEINLRRTMGHVALSLSPDDDEILRVMQISYENRYKLSVRRMY